MDIAGIIVTNKFILGKGKDGIYSDLKILVRKANFATVLRSESIKNRDEKLLFDIEVLLLEWIKGYADKHVMLEVVILDVGIDMEGRNYATRNSVDGAMREALPKIGIIPPPIFSGE